MVDDQSIYKVNLFSLRKNIVVSRNYSFDDTIRNNITYAKLNATDEEISSAADTLQMILFKSCQISTIL